MGKDMRIKGILSSAIIILLIASVFGGAFVYSASADTVEDSGDSKWKTIDDFEGQPDGSEPDGWVDTSDDYLENRFEIDTSEYYNKDASLFFKGSDFEVKARGYKPFSKVKPSEMKAYYRRNQEKDYREDNTDSQAIGWRNGDGNDLLMVNIVTKGYSNDGMAWEPTGATKEDGEGGSHDGDMIVAGKTEVWYEIHWYNINWEKGIYDIDVKDPADGSVVASWNDLEFNKTLGGVGQAYVSAKGWMTAGARADNFSIARRGSDFQIDIKEDIQESSKGESVTLDYTVNNTGEVEDTQEIKLKVDEELKESLEVTLGEEERYEGEFVWETEGVEPGEHTVKIVSEDDFESVNVTVIDPPFFEVNLEDPSADKEVVEGDKVSVTYNVTNIGGTSDTQNISFEVDGELKDTEKDIHLESGEVFEGDFTWKAELPKDYELSLYSEDDEENVTVPVLEEPYFEVDISELDVQAEQERGVPGLTITVTLDYSIQNTGEATETQEIDFVVKKRNKGEVVFEDSQEVTLGDNETYEGSFEWETTTTENAGWYIFEVNSDDEREQVETQIPSRGRRNKPRGRDVSELKQDAHLRRSSEHSLRSLVKRVEKTY